MCAAFWSNDRGYGLGYICISLFKHDLFRVDLKYLRPAVQCTLQTDALYLFDDFALLQIWQVRALIAAQLQSTALCKLCVEVVHCNIGKSCLPSFGSAWYFCKLL